MSIILVKDQNDQSKTKNEEVHYVYMFTQQNNKWNTE